jgi:hypothetical protein
MLETRYLFQFDKFSIFGVILEKLEISFDFGQIMVKLRFL